MVSKVSKSVLFVFFLVAYVALEMFYFPLIITLALAVITISPLRMALKDFFRRHFGSLAVDFREHRPYYLSLLVVIPILICAHLVAEYLSVRVFHNVPSPDDLSLASYSVGTLFIGPLFDSILIGYYGLEYLRSKPIWAGRAISVWVFIALVITGTHSLHSGLYIFFVCVYALISGRLWISTLMSALSGILFDLWLYKARQDGLEITSDIRVIGGTAALLILFSVLSYVFTRRRVNHSKIFRFKPTFLLKDEGDLEVRRLTGRWLMVPLFFVAVIFADLLFDVSMRLESVTGLSFNRYRLMNPNPTADAASGLGETKIRFISMSEPIWSGDDNFISEFSAYNCASARIKNLKCVRNRFRLVRPKASPSRCLVMIDQFNLIFEPAKAGAWQLTYPSSGDREYFSEAGRKLEFRRTYEETDAKGKLEYKTTPWQTAKMRYFKKEVSKRGVFGKTSTEVVETPYGEEEYFSGKLPQEFTAVCTTIKISRWIGGGVHSK